MYIFFTHNPPQAPEMDTVKWFKDGHNLPSTYLHKHQQQAS